MEMISFTSTQLVFFFSSFFSHLLPYMKMMDMTFSYAG